MKNILRSDEARIFFTVWLVYIFFVSGFGGNWMADSMLSSTLAIVDGQKFSIDEYVKGDEDNSFVGGHYYSGFAPGASFLAVPSYVVFKPLFYLIPEGFLGYPHNQLKLIFLNVIATVFVTSLLAALTAVLVYRFAGSFTKKKFLKLLTTFIFSFCTMFFFYGTNFDAKVISTFFSFAAFYILFSIKNSKEQKPSSLFYAGLLIGVSLTVEYSQFLSLVLLFVYLLTFLRNKKIIFFIAGAVIPLLFLLAYHDAVFGSPFTTPYSYRASDYLTSEYNKGFGPTAYSLYGLSFSPFRGLFFYMPILLMSFYGLYIGFKSRKYAAELLFVLFLFVAFFLYNSSLRSELFWAAGCSFGPRHLVPVLPFLVLPLVFVVDKFGKFFVFLLGLLSFLINLLPNLYGVTHLWTYKCMESSPLRFYLPFIFERGITNYTLNLVKEKVFDIPVYLINTIAISSLLVLFLIIYFIWKKN